MYDKSERFEGVGIGVSNKGLVCVKLNTSSDIPATDRM